MSRRWIYLKALPGLAAFLLLVTMFLPLPASAGEASCCFLTDSTTFSSRFGSSEIVYFNGVLTGGLIPSADVYVVRNQSWEGAAGQPLIDVSNPDGIPNTVVGFEVIGWPIYFPTLRVGLYDVVIDHDQDGLYSDGFDEVIGFDTNPGFEVFFDGNVSVIDTARLKAEYAAPVRRTADFAAALSNFVTIVTTADEVRSYVELLATGSFNPLTACKLLVKIVPPGGIEGADRICDPQAHAINWASTQLKGAERNLYRAALAIEADPPDPNYTEVASVDPVETPYPESTDDPLFNDFARGINASNGVTSIARALLHDIERFQGASAAGAADYMELQVGAMRDHAGSLIDALSDASSKVAGIEASLRQVGVEGAVSAEQKELIATLQERLSTSGFTPEEVADMESKGFTPEEIDAMRGEILSVVPGELSPTLTGTLSDLSTALDDGRESIWDLATQAANIANELSEQPPLLVNIGVAEPDGENGWFRSPPSVSLSVGGGATSIYYRIDSGGETRYSDPFTIPEGHHSLIAWALDEFGKPGPITQQSFDVDSTPPTLDVLTSPSEPNGTNGWYRTNPSVQIQAWDGTSGVAQTLFALDGGEPAPYSGEILIGEGNHRLQAWARDVAGNETVSTILQFAVDTTAPSLNLHVDPSAPDGNNGWYTTPPTLSLDGLDALSGVDHIGYSIDGGGLENYEDPVTLVEGIHEFRAWAFDVAGNRSIELLQTFKVDYTPPSGDAKGAESPVTVRAVGQTTKLILSAGDNASPTIRLTVRVLEFTNPDSSVRTIDVGWIRNPRGTVVAVEWDGMNETGAPVVSGMYRFQTIVADEAGWTAASSPSAGFLVL